MPSGRVMIRETMLAIGFMCLFAPIAFALFCAGGILLWAVLGKYFVDYVDQYDSLLACIVAGQIVGSLGIPACLAFWIRRRRRFLRRQLRIRHFFDTFQNPSAPRPA